MLTLNQNKLCSGVHWLIRLWYLTENKGMVGVLIGKMTVEGVE